jgi:hypothetical protein
MHLSSLMPYVFSYEQVYLILMETLAHDKGMSTKIEFFLF